MKQNERGHVGYKTHAKLDYTDDMKPLADFAFWETLVVEKQIALFFKRTTVGQARIFDEDDSPANNDDDNLMSLSLDGLEKLEAAISELLIPLLGKPLAPRVFFPRSLFKYQLQIAVNAFAEMTRNLNPDAMITKKKSIIIRLDTSPTHGRVVVLLHIWRSIYDTFTGARQAGNTAIVQLANALEPFVGSGKTILEISHASNGSVIMFTRNGIALYTNVDCDVKYTVDPALAHPVKLFAVLADILMFVSSGEKDEPPLKKIAAPCTMCRTPTLLGCNVCRTTSYCSRQCQYTDWSVHQSNCIKK